MLRKIVLHGQLAEEFGGPYMMDVVSVREAGRALASQLAGFRKFVADRYFRIWSGPLEVDEDTLDFRLGSLPEIHFLPVVQGAGKAGKIVAGVAIIALSIFTAGAAAGGMAALAADFSAGMGATAMTVMGTTITYGNIAMFGVGMVLAGIATLLTPTSKVSDYGAREAADQRPSFVFNGAVNTMEQGGAVMLVYGRCRVGSSTVSGGLSAEEVTA